MGALVFPWHLPSPRRPAACLYISLPISMCMLLSCPDSGVRGVQDAYDDDDGEGWDGEEDATEDEGSSGLYRPNGSLAASSNGKGPTMGFLGDSPPKSPAKVRGGEAEGGGEGRGGSLCV